MKRYSGIRQRSASQCPTNLKQIVARNGLYLEAVDLQAHETLGGLFSWMHDAYERDRLRTALTFDLFDVRDDFLHYRSQDPSNVYLHQGNPTTGKRRQIPRPPLVQILDDWEDFLQTQEPFEKVYNWVDPNQPQAPNPADTWELLQTTPTPITINFFVDDQGHQRAESNNVDSQGRDRIGRGLRGQPFGHQQLANLLEERSTLSIFSTIWVMRCNPSEVRVWKNDESEPDDFVVLRRDQFEAIVNDWAAFVESPISHSKKYC